MSKLGEPEQHLYFFRPGEMARGMPRWQFGLKSSGHCGALITYPVVDWRWRRCHHKNMEATLDAYTTALIFDEILNMPQSAPLECLPHEVLWSDATEKANGITRDRDTNTLCLSIAISEYPPSKTLCQYSMREDSAALLSSVLYRVVNGLLAPYLGLYPIPTLSKESDSK